MQARKVEMRGLGDVVATLQESVDNCTPPRNSGAAATPAIPQSDAPKRLGDLRSPYCRPWCVCLFVLSLDSGCCDDAGDAALEAGRRPPFPERGSRGFKSLNDSYFTFAIKEHNKVHETNGRKKGKLLN
jgi:hypothetical protein